MPREKLDNSSYSTEIFLKYLQNKKMRILSLWFPREGRDMKIQGTDENTHITNNTLHVREFHNTYWFFFFFFFFIELLGRIERNCSWQLCFTYNDGLNYKRDVDNSNFPFWRGTGLIEMNPTNVESMTESTFSQNSLLLSLQTLSTRDPADHSRNAGDLLQKCWFLHLMFFSNNADLMWLLVD